MTGGILTPCPNCQTALHFSGPLYVVQGDPLNDIWMCDVCGLVYKPAFNENPAASTGNYYRVDSWSGNTDAHRSRLAEIVQAIGDVGLGPNDTVLDIGAGIGLLYEAMAEAQPRMPRFVAVEPVREVALHLKALHPAVVALNAAFDDVVLPPRSCKVVFVCGVDYLFRDIEAAFVKIAGLLTDDGVVVIQRNVFLDQQGYVGSEITDMDSLFSANPLMRTWFHSEQYVEFVRRFLSVTRTWRIEQRFQRPGGGEFVGYTLSLVCGRRHGAEPVPGSIRSYRDATLRRLDELRQRVT